MAGERTGVGEVSHRAARNAAVRGIAEILGKVATLAWTVAAARMLSTADFGAVSYAMALMLMLTAIAAWGFDSAVIRQGSAEPEKLPRLYAGAQAWKTGLALPVFVAAALVAAVTRSSTEAALVLVLMLAAGFPELWSHTARSVASARQVPGGIATALVVQRFATAAGVLGALLAGWGAAGAALGFLVGTLTGWAAHHRALRPLVERRPLLALRRPDLQLAASGTLLVGLSAMVLMLLFRLDVILLGYFVGDEGVAIYSVAYRLLETVLFVVFAIGHAVLPVMSATGSADRRRSGYERAMSVAGFLYVPFFVVSLLEGEAVLELLFGARYSEPAAASLAWLSAAPIFYAAAFFASSLLIAIRRNRTLLAATTTALIVNVVLNLLLIPPYGPAGAAAATTIAYALQTSVAIGLLKKNGDRPRVFVPLLPAAAAALPLVGLLLLLQLPVLVELTLGGVVYLAGWVLVVRRVAPEQEQIIRELLRRKGKSAKPVAPDAGTES